MTEKLSHLLTDEDLFWMIFRFKHPKGWAINAITAVTQIRFNGTHFLDTLTQVLAYLDGRDALLLDNHFQWETDGNKQYDNKVLLRRAACLLLKW